jgi:chromosome segregation ATPase
MNYNIESADVIAISSTELARLKSERDALKARVGEYERTDNDRAMECLNLQKERDDLACELEQLKLHCEHLDALRSSLFRERDHYCAMSEAFRNALIRIRALTASYGPVYLTAREVLARYPNPLPEEKK